MAYEGTAASGTLLQAKGALVSPAFTTATYPATTTANQLLYSSATNSVGGLSTANNSVLITSGGGVPSLSSTLPTAVQSNITQLSNTVSTSTSNPGAPNYQQIVNQGTTAGSNANFQAYVQNTGTPSYAGYQSNVNGGNTWAQGVSNSNNHYSIWNGGWGATLIWDSTSAGQITMPQQPAFSAYVNTSITNTTGNGAQYQISANWTSIFDQGSNFNISTGVFTAPIAGKYRFEATINMENLTGVTSLNFQMLYNSASNLYFFEGAVAASPASNRQSATGAWTVSMAANDTMSLRVQGHGAGGNTATVTGGALAGNPVFTSFSGSLVC
jgi:hypothetical protein